MHELRVTETTLPLANYSVMNNANLENFSDFSGESYAYQISLGCKLVRVGIKTVNTLVHIFESSINQMKQTEGLGFFSFLLLILITLKLCGVISLSWFWVIFLPIGIPLITVLIIITGIILWT